MQKKTTGSTFDEGTKKVETGDDRVSIVADEKTEEKTTGSTFDEEKQAVSIGEGGKVTYGATANTTAEADAFPDTDKPATSHSDKAVPLTPIRLLLLMLGNPPPKPQPLPLQKPTRSTSQRQKRTHSAAKHGGSYKTPSKPWTKRRYTTRTATPGN